MLSTFIKLPFVIIRSLFCLFLSGRLRPVLLYSLVENQNDPELDFKVFFFVDSCWRGIVLDESN